MATASPDVRIVQVGKPEVLALALAQVATLAAIELLRAGRYAPTEADTRAISHRTVTAILAVAPALVEKFGDFTDDEIAEAAERVGRDAVLAVMGQPCPEALN